MAFTLLLSPAQTHIFNFVGSDDCWDCYSGSPSDPRFSEPSELPARSQPTFVGSVRQHDDQLKALRNENFQLKLRIYVLEQQSAEQRQPLPSSAGDECVMLRAELHDKHELICEAAIAMDQMDEQLLYERHRAAELQSCHVRAERELAGQKGEVAHLQALNNELQVRGVLVYV